MIEPAYGRRIKLMLTMVGLVVTALIVLPASVALASGAPVVFPDADLDAVVHAAIGFHPGQPIWASNLATLTSLVATSDDITDVDGLQYATNLTSLDLSGNEIATITPLRGFTNLRELDVTGNELDVTAGSSAMSVIATFEGFGAHVSYQPQRADLSQPAVSASASKYGKPVTFSASIVPQGAAVSGTSKVRLFHLETKTVTKKVKGKKKKVAVNYWRLRKTLTMQESPTAGLSAKGKLPRAGKWQAQVAYAGSADYESCTSTVCAFVVEDPRIEAAISWARHRLGSHAWDHKCLRFVADCYANGAGASVHRYETANQAADALHAAKHPSTNAPRGAYVFFHSMHGRTDLGHVGISLGNGTMINDYGGAGVKIMSIKNCTNHYIGWATPPLSPAIGDWLKPTAR